VTAVSRISIPAPARASSTYSVFGTSEDLIYVIDPPGERVWLLAWKDKREIAFRSYSDLPCAEREGEKRRGIEDWIPIPNTLSVVMRHCGLLYLVEGRTLDIQFTFPKASGERLDRLAYSPSGNKLALEAGGPDRASGKARILIFDLAQRALSEELRVQGSMAFPIYSPEGRRLLAQIETLRPSQPGSRVYDRTECHVLAWDTKTWSLLSKKELCFKSAWVFATSDSVVVEIYPDSLIFRDLETGLALRRIESDRPLNYPVVSPSRRWVAASVANDPGDSPGYAQDFAIWNLETGKMSFQSAKRSWLLHPGFSDVRMSWSPSETHLVVSNGHEITVYKIQ
jgi:hypothetical protein